MLYLIRSYGKTTSILKIGFTKNLPKRLEQYFHTSPLYDFISTREGDEILEKLLHYYLYFLGYQFKRNGKLDEWFIDCSEVYQLFHMSQESLEKKIWKHRNKIFNKDRIFPRNNNNSKDLFLFKYLYEKNKDDFRIEDIKFSNKDSVDYVFFKRHLIKSAQDSFAEKYKECPEFLDFKFKFDELGFFADKMRIYCEFMDIYKESRYIISLISSYVKDPDFQKFYRVYGSQGCKAKRFERGELEKGMSDQGKIINEIDKICSCFVIGEKYTKVEIKQKLSLVYSQLGISKTAKASDLGNYFELENARISNQETGKRDAGFKIISRK